MRSIHIVMTLIILCQPVHAEINTLCVNSLTRKIQSAENPEELRECVTSMGETKVNSADSCQIMFDVAVRLYDLIEIESDISSDTYFVIQMVLKNLRNANKINAVDEELHLELASAAAACVHRLLSRKTTLDDSDLVLRRSITRDLLSAWYRADSSYEALRAKVRPDEREALPLNGPDIPNTLINEYFEGRRGKEKLLIGPLRPEDVEDENLRAKIQREWDEWDELFKTHSRLHRLERLRDLYGQYPDSVFPEQLCRLYRISPRDIDELEDALRNKHLEKGLIENILQKVRD